MIRQIIYFWKRNEAVGPTLAILASSGLPSMIGGTTVSGASGGCRLCQYSIEPTPRQLDQSPSKSIEEEK
jgi:hypothetical protein